MPRLWSELAYLNSVSLRPPLVIAGGSVNFSPVGLPWTLRTNSSTRSSACAKGMSSGAVSHSYEPMRVLLGGATT